MGTIRISDFIRARRENLLSEWEESVRMFPATQALDRSSLIDNMPQVLSGIIDWVDRGRPDDLHAIEQLACSHACQRLENGLDLRLLVSECRILRGCILRRLCELRGQEIDHIEELDEAIDAMIVSSVTCYYEGRERAARAAELQLGRILATLPIAVWVADAGGKITLSNEAARRLWGGELYVPLEQYDRFKAWWPDGRRLASNDWGLSRALRTGEVIIGEELRIEAFDGSHKTIRNSAAPIVDEAGLVVGGVAVNEDITSLKRAEATRDLFAGILGHDLRSPLNAITMAAFLLLKSDGLSEAQRQGVVRVQSAATRIKQLIDGLLDFTRARFGMGFPIRPASVDMGEICAHIVDEVRTAHPERVIQLVSVGDLHGSWDPERVAQVISNLVGNAVQHGEDPITVEANDAAESVLVCISNHGAPISEQKRTSLFEPFRKGDDSRGIGLGLFIAREIVRSHGGTIECMSSEQATTFTTRWPRASHAE
jgi:PAS domain S-box-containing protein